MLEYLGCWGLSGFIAVLCIPCECIKRLNKRTALLLLFILGPMCWIIFPIAILRGGGWADEEERESKRRLYEG